MFRRILRNRKGQGLVEYGLIIAGVTLICAAAISIFGHKTSDIISAVATILPGAHDDDNLPIVSGHLIETGDNGNGANQLDVGTIGGTASGTARLENNVLGLGSTAGNGTDFGGLILESN